MLWLKLLCLFLLAALGCAPEAGKGSLLGSKPPRIMTFSWSGERVSDGVAATPGSAWNGTESCIIEMGGGLEWDLGRVERLRRAWLQGDSDDRYVFMTSTDGKAWLDAWEAPPVEAQVGLRDRTSPVFDVQARYVRLEPRGGDGRYAVSELDLTTDVSAAWPPAKKLVSVPRGSDRTKEGLRGLMVLAALLAGAALFGADTETFRRLTRGRTLPRPLVWLSALIGAFVAGTAFWYSKLYRFNLVDDSYISLQYAKNWASGNGLVFNLGERVEGYSNFLWVALTTPLWPLSGAAPALMSRLAAALATAFAVLALVLLVLAARKAFAGNALPVAFAALLLAFDDSYIGYAVIFALENHLLIALMMAALLLVLYRPRRWEWLLGLVFALVGMTRPDGVLWAVTFFGAYGLAALRKPKLETLAADRIALLSLFKVAGAFVVLFGIYGAARYWYFGELLPNTFHLKVGGSFSGVERGIDYMRGYFLQRWGMPVLGILGALLIDALWPRWLLVHAFLHMAYVTYVGGDFYGGHRFLLVVTPSLALLSGGLLQRVLAWAPSRQLRYAAIAGAVLACLAMRWATLRGGTYVSHLNGQVLSVDHNVRYMQWLKSVARPGSSMVVGDIGATGFFADMRVQDVFGVVEPKVARKVVPTLGKGWAGHEKRATREEQLAENATYIKWGYVDDSRTPPGYYIHNVFPLELHVEGLWVKDDLERGKLLQARFRMNPGELASWERSGDAFAATPSRGAIGDQQVLTGHRGHLINSYGAATGDRATGRLSSPEFTLVGDRLRLLVGGGHDPERLRVSLWVEGKRVFSETGSNWETLGRREWDVRPFRDKPARLEVVDEAVGAWGHILVDEVEQWSGAPSTSGKL